LGPGGVGFGQGLLHLQGFTVQQGHSQMPALMDVGPFFTGALGFFIAPRRRPSRIKTRGIESKIHPSAGPLLWQM
jgi:hypothetical protein